MTILLEWLGAGDFKTFLSIFKVWKQDARTALICMVMSSFLLMKISRSRTWVLGVGPSSAGDHLESHGEVLLQQITSSFLSVLSLRQLDFIHSATSVMHAENILLVIGFVSERERIS